MFIPLSIPLFVGFQHVSTIQGDAGFLPSTVVTHSQAQRMVPVFGESTRLTERKNEHDAAVSLNFNDEQFAYLRRTSALLPYGPHGGVPREGTQIPLGSQLHNPKTALEHLKTAGASAVVRTNKTPDV